MWILYHKLSDNLKYIVHEGSRKLTADSCYLKVKTGCLDNVVMLSNSFLFVCICFGLQFFLPEHDYTFMLTTLKWVNRILKKSAKYYYYSFTKI